MVVKTKHEEKLEALEEKAPDALEVAAQKDEEGKTKKDTALKVSATSKLCFFCTEYSFVLLLRLLNRRRILFCRRQHYTKALLMTS
jgi:hypothetical protein